VLIDNSITQWKRTYGGEQTCEQMIAIWMQTNANDVKCKMMV